MLKVIRCSSDYKVVAVEDDLNVCIHVCDYGRYRDEAWHQITRDQASKGYFSGIADSLGWGDHSDGNDDPQGLTFATLTELTAWREAKYEEVIREELKLIVAAEDLSAETRAEAQEALNRLVKSE